MLVEQIPVPQLSPLEWRTVAIALRDAASAAPCPAMGPGSAWSRLLDLVFAPRRSPALADPRLETLRQFVCETRRTRKLASDMVPAMIDQGYSSRQIDAIALLSA